MQYGHRTGLRVSTKWMFKQPSKDIPINDPKIDQIQTDLESIGALSFPSENDDVISYVTKMVPDYICNLLNVTRNCQPLDELVTQAWVSFL